MRIVAAVLAFAIASLLASPAALAEPCRRGPQCPRFCCCNPPLVRVCGWVWNDYFQRDVMQCWCHNPSAGGGASGPGSYGTAEIHKRNVPTVTPGPGPTGAMIWTRRRAGVIGAPVAPRLMRRWMVR
jgi:hypothetical protein